MTTDLSGPSRRKHFTLVATAAAMLAIDLATKIAASAALADRDIDLPGPLDLRLSHNPGVAFGMGTDTPTWLVLTLTGAVAAGIAVAAWRGLFASSIAAGVVVGAAGAALEGDLAERDMLGDCGANSLGAATGAVVAFGAPRLARCAVLAGTVALNLVSERISFTEVIARTRVLRDLDELGRRG